MENSIFSANNLYLCAENNDTHPVRIANPIYDHAFKSNSLKDEDVRQKLLVEQEIEDLFAAQEATKARLEDQVRIEFEQKSLALQEKDKALQEKNAALLEKDAALQEKDAALQEKNEAITKMVNILTQLGKSDAEISDITGLNSEQIEKIRKL